MRRVLRRKRENSATAKRTAATTRRYATLRYLSYCIMDTVPQFFSFYCLPFFFFFLLHLGTAATFVLEQPSSQNLMVSFTASVSQRLEGIESKLQALDATCKALAQKLDSMVPCAKNSIQVPMVAGSPQGATQTWNKVRW